MVQYFKFKYGMERFNFQNYSYFHWKGPYALRPSERKIHVLGLRHTIVLSITIECYYQILMFSFKKAFKIHSYSRSVCKLNLAQYILVHCTAHCTTALCSHPDFLLSAHYIWNWLHGQTCAGSFTLDPQQSKEQPGRLPCINICVLLFL